MCAQELIYVSAGVSLQDHNKESDDSHVSQDTQMDTPSVGSNGGEPPKLPHSSRSVWGAPVLPSSSPPSSTNFARMERYNTPLQKAKTAASLFTGVVGGDSSNGMSSSSESGSSFSKGLRPGTPPKPSLRQIRRTSINQVAPDGKDNEAADEVEPIGKVSVAKTRRLWDNFQLRSTKSEYNLSFVGDPATPPPRVNPHSAAHKANAQYTPAEQILDLSGRALTNDGKDNQAIELARVAANLRKINQRVDAPHFTPVNKPPLSKRREALSAQISENRKKLEIVSNCF